MVDLYLKKTKKLLTKRFVWCYYPKRKGKGVFHVDNRKDALAF